MTLRFSVVINTYNRVNHLRIALRALEALDYPEYEIVVVNGPSTDGTDELLKSYGDRIKTASCDETNLSKSRNIGIALSAGDIVCFTDDDGIPEPSWLKWLAEIYLADPQAAAVGGFVRDHTGVAYQTRYIVSDSWGNSNFFDDYAAAQGYILAGEGRFFGLIGVNSSFRRSALAEVGGFDEEYAYFLDETDVCARLVRAGWQTRLTPEAQVHHKYAASHLRNDKKVPSSVYFPTRSKVYYTIQNALPGVPAHAIFEAAERVRGQLRWDVNNLGRIRAIDAGKRQTMLEEVEAGYRDALEHAFAHPGGQARLSDYAQLEQPFLKFSPARPEGGHRSLILISQDYPPRPCGGVGVFMHRLAEELARQGHEISVITRSTGGHTVDYENGVWVHRLPMTDHGGRNTPPVPDIPGQMRNAAYSVYDEAMRIQAMRGTTTTLSSIWDLEAAACVGSNAFTDLVYLVTTYQLSLPSKPEWTQNPHFLEHHVNKMIAGERWVMERADQVVASTTGIWDDVRKGNEGIEVKRDVPVIPFGLPVAAAQRPPAPAGYPAERTNVLFVGRFEYRKGIDLLLDIIPDLVHSNPNVNFRLAGDDTIRVDGTTYKDRFLEKNAGNAAVLDRVQFLGFVSDADLNAEYAHCDLFVAPSRYESFGLIYLEAMRWAKPCVGCDVGGIPEVLTPECGRLVPIDDRNALRRAIEELSGDQDLRRRMGEAGLARFTAGFSVESYAERLLAEIARIS